MIIDSQNAFRRVQQNLTNLLHIGHSKYKEYNEIALAISKGLIDELNEMYGNGMTGTYYNSETLEMCWYATHPIGENISKGMSVCELQGAGSDLVYRTPTSGNSLDMPIGIALESGLAGQSIKIATTGLVLALPESGITAVKGWLTYSSTNEAGRLLQAADAGTAQHWRENGHWCLNGTGPGALTRMFIHYN
jgi:hypothetical protein